MHLSSYNPMRYSWIHHACTIILFSQITLTQLHYRMSDHLEKHYSIERLEVGDIDLEKVQILMSFKFSSFSQRKECCPKLVFAFCLETREYAMTM